MSEAQEKDNFWIYVAGIIVAAIIVIVMVKGSEHDKYVTAAKAIAEDSNNSSYKK